MIFLLSFLALSPLDLAVVDLSVKEGGYVAVCSEGSDIRTQGVCIEGLDNEALSRVESRLIDLGFSVK